MSLDLFRLLHTVFSYVSSEWGVPAFVPEVVDKLSVFLDASSGKFSITLIFRLTFCSLPKSLEKHDKSVFFLTNKIVESLGGSGYSVERLSVPYVPQVTGEKPTSIRNGYQHFYSSFVHISQQRHVQMGDVHPLTPEFWLIYP